MKDIIYQLDFGLSGSTHDVNNETKCINNEGNAFPLASIEIQLQQRVLTKRLVT